jgi:hypothetical protein
MKISFDYHNTITKYPKIFRELSKLWAKKHTIWVCSGASLDTTGKNLGEYGIIFHKYFSIIDYHKRIGTKIYVKNGKWHIQDHLWNRTKGDWAEKEKIDIHFDDTAIYAPYFPKSCEFALVDDNFVKNFAVYANKIGGIV